VECGDRFSGRLEISRTMPFGESAMGGTPARYTDDCGHGIYQFQGQGYAPNNICRDPYTDFCGFFYQNNGTAFVA